MFKEMQKKNLVNRKVTNQSINQSVSTLVNQSVIDFSHHNTLGFYPLVHMTAAVLVDVSTR